MDVVVDNRAIGLPQSGPPVHLGFDRYLLIAAKGSGTFLRRSL